MTDVLERGTIRGFSGDADFIVPQRDEEHETSITLGQRQVDAMVRLLDACHEASEDPETDPVQPVTFGHAEAFLGAIPPRIPLPDIMVHPDGEIAFEWHVARDRVLTVSVGSSACVAFASLHGASTVYGREPFTGFIPDQVAYLLGRLYPTQAFNFIR